MTHAVVGRLIARLKRPLAAAGCIGLTVAACALGAATLPVSAASAASENFNCNTLYSEPCGFAQSYTVSWMAQTYAIDYTHNGACAGVYSWNGGLYADACTNLTSYSAVACSGGPQENGGGYGAAWNEYGFHDNLAGTISDTCWIEV